MGSNSPLWLEQGLQGVAVAQQEILLFAAFWIVVGAIDEIFMDIAWLWLRMTGRARAALLPAGAAEAPLAGPAAVMVPAWSEHAVIGALVSHTLAAWRQRDYVLYVGCYRNDPLTAQVALAAGGDDPRLRVVVVDADGPTTKGDCLNRLYATLCADEAAADRLYRSIVFQDAEDMVHPAGLAAIDAALDTVDFVQLPVRPQLLRHSRWIAGHYADEFRESHGKDMVVRDALGAAIPAAGVGCGFSRGIIAAVAEHRKAAGESGLFSAGSLTEDYELGLMVAQLGGRSRFLRLRDPDGELVGTKCYFPDHFEPAVRQKARWVHGIAFQGWDRLGWSGRWIDRWMALRDRRGPLTALVLAAGYLMIVLAALIGVGQLLGHRVGVPIGPALAAMVGLCLAVMFWRMAFRFAFTASEYGLTEGLRAVVRIWAIANFIAVLAAQRAVLAYVRSLWSGRVVWDKTEHRMHPADTPG